MSHDLKMQKIFSGLLRTVLVMGLVAGASSCSMNPFDEQHQAVSGMPPRKVKNANPKIIEVSASDHEKAVREQISQGAFLSGYSEKKAQENISIEQARIFATNKNADLAVFSKQHTGNSIQYHSVPVQSEKIENQKKSKQTNSSTTTKMGYRELQLPVWLYRVSLLRFPENRKTPLLVKPQSSPAPLTKASPKKNPSKTAMVEQKEEPATFETLKTTETIKESKPIISGDL